MRAATLSARHSLKPTAVHDARLFVTERNTIESDRQTNGAQLMATDVGPSTSSTPRLATPRSPTTSAPASGWQSGTDGGGDIHPLSSPFELLQTAHLMLLSAPISNADAERDPSTRLAEVMDRSVHYWIARWTFGLSPITLWQAYADWAMHIAVSPGKQTQLAQKAARKATRLARHVARTTVDDRPCTEPCIEPLPYDKRFAAAEWQSWPFSVIYQGFLLQQQWWYNAMTGVHGVSAHHEAIADFTTRQLLDMYSPSNFVWTNPVVMRRTQEEAGQNLVRGWWNLVEDWERALNGRPPAGADRFKAGRDLATTPGKVVFRNRLIELIQYSPTTGNVHPEPILIVPAWIMKYYILDLTAEKSLVRHLVDHGFTVFMISWLNPDAGDRDLTLDDYRRLGLLAALGAVEKIVPGQKVHGAGYCLGGTLLAIAAAAMARDGDYRFASLSFLAAQVDFEEAGELTLFIDESQIAMIEDMMWEQGYLDAHQMAGAFQMLRSNDLIWSRAIHNYLMGERRPVFDLMAWNADATRMPYKMHAEYLRSLFLKNDLAEGRFEVDGKPVALSDIDVPVFAAGTETDHVAPWHSVYKFNLLLEAEVTFVLTSGGHNAGIVPDPKFSKPHYRIGKRAEREHYLDPDTWLDANSAQDGIWWQAWSDWLVRRSGPTAAPPKLGAPHAGLPPLADAPGSYVHRP